MLDVLLDRIGDHVMQSGKREEKEEEVISIEVISESVVLLRTLANAPNWLPTMRRTFIDIVRRTLSAVSPPTTSTSKKEQVDPAVAPYDPRTLSRCAAVFSVVGGY